MDKGYTLPLELAEKIRKENEKIAAKYRDRAEQYDVYSEFVETQKQAFSNDIQMVLKILEQLIMSGKLYINTKLIARIKDPESAINNDDEICQDELMKKILEQINENDYKIEEKIDEKPKEKSFNGKALDDIFGITIVTDTKQEVEEVYKALKDTFEIGKEKTLDKEGYHAKHLYFWNKSANNEESPIIECQLKTTENYIQTYDHTLYKVESNITKTLNQKAEPGKSFKAQLNTAGEKKVWEIIQKFYNNNKFSTLTNVPRMWEATFNEDTEQMELEKLTEAQTLKRVYHNLVIRSNKFLNR